jgi:hypothetical protein
MQLPNVGGYNLNRQKMNFPADFSGRLNLVFIPFQRWHQEIIDAWVPFVVGLSQGYAELSYYEFPTLPHSNFLYRTLLNEGMRAGIPSRETRARTITLYLDKAAFRQALDIPHERDVWLYLFTKTGAVVWRTAGAYTAEKGELLAAAVAGHLADEGVGPHSNGGEN